MHDAVGVDVEGHLDLRHAARSRRDAAEAEAAEGAVVTRHRALALAHVDLDRGLVVGGRGEGLRLAGRDRGVARDEHGHHAAEGLDAEAQRGHVDEHDVGHVAGEHARLDRRAEADDLVGVDGAVGLFAAEELLDGLLDHRDAGRAADEQDLVDLRDGLLGVRERLLERVDGALDEVLDHALELGARELDLHVLRAGRVRRQEGQVDLGLRRRRQLDLRLLGGVLEALQHQLVAADVDADVLLELLDQPLDDAIVEVVAAEVRVAVGRDDLDHVLRDLEDRDVEGAASEVVDRDDLLLGGAGLALAEAVREGGGGRLVDDALDLEAGDTAGVLGGLALGVVEVRGHRDDGLGDRLVEVVLGSLLQLHQHAGADLGRRVHLAADADLGVTVGRAHDLVGHAGDFSLQVIVGHAHEALDRKHGVLGVRDRLASSLLTDEHVAVLLEGDDRGGGPAALFVGDDFRLVALHDADDGVRRTEVDSNDLSHEFPLLPFRFGRQDKARPRGVNAGPNTLLAAAWAPPKRRNAKGPQGRVGPRGRTATPTAVGAGPQLLAAGVSTGAGAGGAGAAGAAAGSAGAAGSTGSGSAKMCTAASSTFFT